MLDEFPEDHYVVFVETVEIDEGGGFVRDQGVAYSNSLFSLAVALRRSLGKGFVVSNTKGRFTFYGDGSRIVLSLFAIERGIELQETEIECRTQELERAFNGWKKYL